MFSSVNRLIFAQHETSKTKYKLKRLCHEILLTCGEVPAHVRDAGPGAGEVALLQAGQLLTLR
jgi:hypothetical protein